MRSQIASGIGSALASQTFLEVVIREGSDGLSHLLQKPVEFAPASELFRLDLLRYLDPARLQIVARD